MHTFVQLVKESSHPPSITPVTAAPLQDHFRKAEVLCEHFVDVLCSLQSQGICFCNLGWFSRQAEAGGGFRRLDKCKSTGLRTSAWWIREVLDRPRGYVGTLAVAQGPTSKSSTHLCRQKGLLSKLQKRIMAKPLKCCIVVSEAAPVD